MLREDVWTDSTLAGGRGMLSYLKDKLKVALGEEEKCLGENIPARMKSICKDCEAGTERQRWLS